MTLSTVTWRQAVAAAAATFIGLFAIIVVVRADGLPAVDAASARATSWFVHQPTGRIVLVDGYRGTALGSIDAGTQGEQLTVAEGGPGAYVLNDTTAEARAIDSVDLRLGTPFGLATLGDGRAQAGVGQAGLVVVNSDENAANVVPVDGEPVSFAVDAGSQTQIAPDGSIWSLVGGDLVRTTSLGPSTIELGVPSAVLSLVGSEPFVVDAERHRARLGHGGWQTLPTDVAPSEIVTQVPGPTADCGWVGANDDLWCVGSDSIEESSTIGGLDIDGGDLLSIAGDAAVLVRRGPSSIVRLDWRANTKLEDQPADVSSDAALAITAMTDLIWVDDTAGDYVWAVNPWSIEAIDKGAQGIPVLGEDGEIIDAGESSSDPTPGLQERSANQPEEREPDDNGVDDPPVAVDDPVTARSGASVVVEVTANDYDPDGEAIAISSVGSPGHGSVDIGTANTVVYTPDSGYVGVDRFEYTIVDGNGTTASASVVIELLAPGTTNKPPVGVADTVETGAGVAVTVDVLLNDVDPERDALRIGGFSPPDGLATSAIGEVTETIGPSNLPALRFTPVEGFEGAAIFRYRPIDAQGAVGDDVEVRVEVARAGDPNRPPVTRPDAVRLRRNVTTPLTVLVNDTDPDGDQLTLSVVEPLPPGLEVEVEGEQLAVTARAGAAALVPFEYSVDDEHGHQVRGSVLVGVLDDVEPNRPPVVTADTDKVVVGDSVVIEVTANDVDPDGDPLTVLDVTQPDDSSGDAVVFSRDQIRFTPSAVLNDSTQTTARFTYTVSDGNAHEVTGEVTVTVLPEALMEAPYARDDSTFTFVDIPVTIDVLRNDGDPSGGRPTLVGRPGCASGGTATVTTDGQIRFDPPRGASGAYRCTYEVTNASGRTASASIIVSVRAPAVTNEAPKAVDDYVTVEVGATIVKDVTENDSDREDPRSALRVVSSTAPVLGSAQRNGNVITFVAGTQTGTATIKYQLTDTDGAVSLGQLSVRVIERQNQAPEAVGDAQVIFGPGTPQQFSVLANDRDPDETPGGLSVVSVKAVSGDGSVSLSGNIVTITPNPSLVGQVVASYIIRDGAGLTATANVVLTVQKPLNRPPDARDDSNEVVNGGSVSTAVLFNDIDPDGDPLSMVITAGPDGSIGSATVGANRSINFTAVPGASGVATIGYQISDGVLTDDAVLRITVRPCSQSTPVAADAFLKTGYQQPIAIDLGAYGSNGTIIDVSGPPGLSGGIYTPPAGENGNVTIDYSVVNSCRLRASGRVTIDVNQDPVGRPWSAVVSRGTERVIPVTDLASDAEVLSISASAGAPDWAQTSPDRLVITAAAPSGNYSWTTTVVDPGGLTTSVPVSVSIVNPPPVANPDDIDVRGGPATVDIVANDSNPLGDNGALQIRSIPSQITFENGVVGSVTVDPDDRRRITVDPAGGLGTATFTYTVVNGEGDVSAPATVRVLGNRPPQVTDQAVSVTTGVATPVALTVSDADGDALTLVELQDPSLVVAGTSGTTLTINAASAGTWAVTYRVRDSRGALSAVATLTVTASPPATTTPP